MQIVIDYPPKGDLLFLRTCWSRKCLEIFQEIEYKAYDAVQVTQYKDSAPKTYNTLRINVHKNKVTLSSILYNVKMTLNRMRNKE